MDLAMDLTADVEPAFLIFTSVLWIVSGAYARGYLHDDPRRRVFWAFFLATMIGNIGCVRARDLGSFYAFFALMSLASYGLIAHDQSAKARRAANVYLVLVLVGDVLILGALLLMLDGMSNLPFADVPGVVAVSRHRAWIVGLVLAGFGVKAGGVLPLHVWLPLAHPVAPTPASALLSGAMINVGLLGWLRCLPLGLVALPGYGAYVATAGLLAAFYAAAVGAVQRDPKTVLAYSSVSQMGFMMLAVGIGLAVPDSASLVSTAIAVFALHHALAKGALFLGAPLARAQHSLWSRRAVALGLLWLAWEIAGGPLSSGSLAKQALKPVLKAAPAYGLALELLASVAAVGSTLLMVRFLSLSLPRRVQEEHGPLRRALWLPWVALLAIDTWLLLRMPVGGVNASTLLTPGALWGSLWPLLVGLAVAGLAWRSGRRGAQLPAVPAGDVLVPVLATFHAARRAYANARAPSRAAAGGVPTGHALLSSRSRERSLEAVLRTFETLESHVTRFPVVGALLFLLLGLLIASGYLEGFPRAR